MKEEEIVGFVRVITILSIIVIVITASPILLRPPIAAEAKVSVRL